jgi:hypothetical protein
MRNIPAGMQIALAWYRAEDWERLRRLCPDWDKKQDSYEKWRADAMDTERKMKRYGYTVVRVVVDPDELAGWCAMRGLMPTADTRTKYVIERAEQGAGGPQR